MAHNVTAAALFCRVLLGLSCAAAAPRRVTPPYCPRPEVPSSIISPQAVKAAAGPGDAPELTESLGARDGVPAVPGTLAWRQCAGKRPIRRSVARCVCVYESACRATLRLFLVVTMTMTLLAVLGARPISRGDRFFCFDGWPHKACAQKSRNSGVHTDLFPLERAKPYHTRPGVLGVPGCSTGPATLREARPRVLTSCRLCCCRCR